MTTYPDLGSCDYFGPSWAERLTAVGWLDASVPSSGEPVGAPLFETLVRLLSDPWQPVVTAGHHRCPFCRFSGGARELRYAGITAALGSSNLFVFDEKRAYVSPSLIAHYIDAHAYVPPQPFQRAVAACPPMKSMDYLKLVRRHGLQGLATPRGVPR
jgi:hypothetical protein